MCWGEGAGDVGPYPRALTAGKLWDIRPSRFVLPRGPVPPGKAEARPGPDHRLVLVGTYPPTPCGLATFTANLRRAIEAPGWRADVLRVVGPPEGLRDEIVGEWAPGDYLSLARALRAIGRCDAVVLQHEYGLFGGPDGEEVLALVYGLDSPLVAVVHTVLLNPSANQRKVLEAVMRAAAVVVVQSKAARSRLLEAHALGPEAVVVVPHGATANFSSLPRREGTGPLVLTWGLLGPGKGIEHAIGAVARLRRRGREVRYLVAGRTHPKVRQSEGESYRESLFALVRDLGVEDLVRFDDAYRDWESLWGLVRSAHAVLLPNESSDQVSSGVLVDALASARPVVATRFPHAEELLVRGAGATVPQGDVGALADALEGVLFEPGAAERMAAAAYGEAQAFLWPTVGARYRSLVEGVVRARKVG